MRAHYAEYGAYPECWNGSFDPQCLTPDPPGFRSCGMFVEAALATYLQLGGRRIDFSDSYVTRVPQTLTLTHKHRFITDADVAVDVAVVARLAVLLLSCFSFGVAAHE
jgi:hypothetical protein